MPNEEERYEALRGWVGRIKEVEDLLLEAQTAIAGRVTCEAASRKLLEAHQVLVMVEEAMIISLLMPEEPA